MPRLDKQLGVLAIRDRPPTRFQNLLYLVRAKKDVSRVTGDTIQGCAQCLQRAECVGDMAGSCIDLYYLR